LSNRKVSWETRENITRLNERRAWRREGGLVNETGLEEEEDGEE
jgi:hypothetical protein